MGSVLLTTIGSWGDLFPFIGVAIELRRQGHDSRIAASPAWAEIVSEAGIDFVPIGRWIGFDEFREHPEIFRRVPFGLRAGLNRYLFDQIDDVTDHLTPAIKAADLVVTHPAQLAALNVAEKLGRPRIVATVFPSMIPSTHSVPGGSPFGPWTGALGRFANRQAWHQATALVSVLFDRPINRHRRQLGLKPIRAGLLGLPRRADATVVMASSAVIPRPPDWPDDVVFTSFVGWDRGGSRPTTPETQQFVEAGDPPVLITLGASTAVDADDFFDVATNAVVAAGARALVITGPASGPRCRFDQQIVHVTDFEPFTALAGQCRAAVHHAGIGTTVACMRAGLPQLAVPKGFDQPVTAALIEQLGIGVAVPWRHRHERMPHAAERVLHDRDLEIAASALSGQLLPDGADTTAAVIAGHLTS